MDHCTNKNIECPSHEASTKERQSQHNAHLAHLASCMRDHSVPQQNNSIDDLRLVQDPPKLQMTSIIISDTQCLNEDADYAPPALAWLCCEALSQYAWQRARIKSSAV